MSDGPTDTDGTRPSNGHPLEVLKSFLETIVRIGGRERERDRDSEAGSFHPPGMGVLIHSGHLRSEAKADFFA